MMDLETPSTSPVEKATNKMETTPDSKNLMSSKSEGVKTGTQPDETSNYLVGWKLHVLTMALSLGLFLSSLEISIVSTSLVAITNDLKGFSQSSWVITAYLLTYSGLLIIWAKISDILGRKLIIITSILIFIAFSVACAVAQTIVQLIICRAFQGIGGAGLYSLVVIIFFELVPPSKYPLYTGLSTCIFGISLLIGPLIGGAINDRTTWRWVFYLNIPPGCIAMLLLIFTLPNRFPNHSKPASQFNAFSSKSLQRLDLPGATLLLAGSILLVSALQEVANGKAWSSPLVIVMLVLCGPLWMSFLSWEWYITSDKHTPEPVFPRRFLTDRVLAGLIINTVLIGVPFFVCLIQLPERFQAVNGTSTLGAGIRLLPFILFSPFGSAVAAALLGKLKISPVLLLISGAVCQTVGLSLLSNLSDSKSISAAQYGYQVITGFGLGMNIATVTLVTPLVIEKTDLAVATSAVLQFRLMGGSIGLAMVTAVINTTTRQKLLPILSLEQFQALLESTAAINSFPPPLQPTVRAIFADGYNLQMRIVIAFGAAQIPASFLLWQRKPKVTE